MQAGRPRRQRPRLVAHRAAPAARRAAPRRAATLRAVAPPRHRALCRSSRGPDGTAGRGGPASRPGRPAIATLTIAAGLVAAAAAEARAAAPGDGATSEDAPSEDSSGAPPKAAESLSYQGSFWAVQLHGGTLLRRGRARDGAIGPTAGVSARLATVLSIADLQATLLGGGYEAAAPDGPPVDVRRWTVGLDARIHPLLLSHLWSNRLGYALGSVYASLGADLAVTHLDPGGAPPDREVDPGWHVGAGLGVPVTAPTRRWTLWLGLSWRLTFLDVSTGGRDLGSFDEHAVMLTLGWRNHDIFFASVPPPPELDTTDRKPPR